MPEEAIQTYTLKDLLLVLFKPAQLDNFDIAKEWILYVNPRDKHVLLSVIEPEKDRKFPTIATMRYLSTNTLVDHYKMFAKVINVMEPEETVEITSDMEYYLSNDLEGEVYRLYLTVLPLPIKIDL